MRGTPEWGVIEQILDNVEKLAVQIAMLGPLSGVEYLRGHVNGIQAVRAALQVATAPPPPIGRVTPREPTGYGGRQLSLSDDYS